MGASSFVELLDARLDASKEKREQFRESLSKASAAITEENAKKAGLKAMEKEYEDRKKAIEKDRADLKSLVAKGSEERATRLDAVSQAADAKRVLVEAAKSKVLVIGRLTEDVKDHRDRRFGEFLRDLRTKRAETGLTEEEWKAFAIGFVGDVDTVARMIKAGKASGPIVDSFKKIQRTHGDDAAFDFLKVEADGFHSTPYGHCINSFTVDPCPKHLECFAGCRHLTATDMPKYRVHLVQLEGRFKDAVKAIESRSLKTIGRDNQLAHAKSRLEAVRQVLVTPDGMQVFPEGADLSKSVTNPRSVLDAHK